jgi:hypothetical protein
MPLYLYWVNWGLVSEFWFDFVLCFYSWLIINGQEPSLFGFIKCYLEHKLHEEHLSCNYIGLYFSVTQTGCESQAGNILATSESWHNTIYRMRLQNPTLDTAWITYCYDIHHEKFSITLTIAVMRITANITPTPKLEMWYPCALNYCLWIDSYMLG